jgi:SAM-dependent methyltransferase
MRSTVDLNSAAAVLRNYESNPFSREIDPADEMWNAGPSWYWGVGRSGLDCIIKGLLASPTPYPRSILDLACGHGRVARHIRSAFPDVRLVWCDISGPDFCVKHFGGEALGSDRELLRVELPRVDAIWIGSLFTHVTEQRARAWLTHICACLNPGGALIATFHGRTTAQLYRSALPDVTPIIDRIEPQCLAAGWGYEPYDAAVDPEWGFSMSAVDCLARLAAAVPDTRIGNLSEGAWAGNQDVLVLIKN